ncbi:uncharacterized protein LOC112873069 [Panicum hallii]|uniref:uncharacterized protein LOC112873069 n=1 Tax=Panicum hallii TaxID=206008 RepID=UPI000DF4D498|nr:uncharacterized protein LOC112873069 [Panicum hallii]
MAAQRDPVPDGVFISDLHAPSIHVKPDSPQRPSDPMPGGPSLIARCAKMFVTTDGELYKRSPSVVGMLMKCILTQQGKDLLLEIHAGICGHHAAPWSLVSDAFRQGFYWPTTLRDAEEVVRTCKECQFYARQIHLPAQALQTNPLTWLFAVWGLTNFTDNKFLEFADGYGIRIDWASVGHPHTNGQVERANGMVL